MTTTKRATTSAQVIAATQPKVTGALQRLSGKIRGGNIVPKAASNGWSDFWAEWDWDNWIRPQVDRAALLGNCVRVIGSPEATFGNPTFGRVSQKVYNARWAQLAAYCAAKGLFLYPALCQWYDFTDSLSTTIPDFQDPTVTAVIVANATVLGGYANVIGFDLFQEGDSLTGVPWQPSTAYVAGQIASNSLGYSYTVTTGGTSASSGGPTGTGGSISDGSVTWAYNGRKAVQVADVLALMASIRNAGVNRPLTMSRSDITGAHGWGDYESMFYEVYTDPAGADFLDFHLYQNGVTPGQPDFQMVETGKPLLIGEFGSAQSNSSGVRVALFQAIAKLHNRPGVLGSMVWALADQSTSSSGKFGMFDNTGFAQTWPAASTAPLSTTSGERTSLTDVLHSFVVADPPLKPYQSPNLLTPLQAAPRNTSLSGNPQGPNIYSGWNPGANTTLVGDGRGLGFRATAAGTALIGAGAPKPAITGSTPYTAYAVVQAASDSRTVSVAIDWYDSGASYLSSATAVQGNDHPEFPITVPCTGVSPSNAAYAVVAVRAFNCAASEMHILQFAGISAVADDHTLYPSLPTPQHWQVPSLSGTWANKSGWTPAGYRITADSLHVELAGVLTTGVANTALFTLASGYRPVSDKSLAGSDPTNQARDVIHVATSGVVTYVGGGTEVSIDGLTFPLDW